MSSATWQEASSRDGLVMHEDPSGSSSSLLLYAILPALVSKRMPKFRTLRRTLSEQQTSSCHARASSYPTLEHLATPPPAYRASIPTPVDSDDESTVCHSYTQQNPAPSRPSSSGSMASPCPDEKKSGIQWKYTETGLSILSLATQEASLPRPAINLIRRQYISGLACILRSLPSDLTAEEELSIREALPDAVRCVGGEDQVVARTSDTSIGHGAEHWRRSSAQRSILHRMIATMTCYIFLAISFILPYIQLLLRQAYQYDRRYKISDRLLASGVATADALGRRTLVIATNVCAMQDGKVGEIMKEAGMYVVQSFSGGVYDGLGDGMQRLGLRGGFQGETGKSRRLQQG